MAESAAGDFDLGWSALAEPTAEDENERDGERAGAFGSDAAGDVALVSGNAGPEHLDVDPPPATSGAPSTEPPLIEAEPAAATSSPAPDGAAATAAAASPLRRRLGFGGRRRRRQAALSPGAPAGQARAGRRFAALILGLTALLAALIGWRTQVVRIAPQTAPVYAALGIPVNLRGLVFEDVKLAFETADGVPVMVVEGVIANKTKREADVPRLRFAIRNGARLETYAWTALPAAPVLPPGGSLPFRTRLASPPPDAQDVLVRFFHRHDLASGT